MGNPNRELLFYDGTCGLCHASVRFLLARDRREVIDFAPLGSAAFRARVDEAQRSTLPDSLVAYTADGRLLVKSAAVLHLAGVLGGFWSGLGAMAGVFPVRLLDGLYDLIARHRRRFFKKPDGACPMIPPRLRSRFLLDE